MPLTRRRAPTDPNNASASREERPTSARQAGVSGPGPSLDSESSSDTPFLDQIETEQAGGVVLADTLKQGSRGPEVARLQEFLGIEADGAFGADTTRAVVAWQRSAGLKADGVVGSDTLAALADGAQGVELERDVRSGARGGEVERLQRFFGLEADGVFGPATRAAVVAFQRQNGLEPDGVVGNKTREALAGAKPEEAARAESAAVEAAPKEEPATEKVPKAVPVAEPVAEEASPRARRESGPTPAPEGELKSRWHNDDKFVPTYGATAYSESGIYRRESDPYAVGAVSNPSKKEDLGGKTYGVYQFESSVYRNGTSRGDKIVKGSTVMRFARWEKNPFGKQLLDAANKHGVATAAFDAVWKSITASDNKGFGEAQQAFMEFEQTDKVAGFMNQVNASDEARADSRLKDLVIGTYNQYDSLTKGIIKHVAALNTRGTMTADQLGKAIQDYKSANVTSNFKSSPKAHEGVRNRIDRERDMFA